MGGFGLWNGPVTAMGRLTVEKIRLENIYK